MKLIEALKQLKDYSRKLEDLQSKIAKHSADLDFETALYPDQKKQVSEWVQAHGDLIREISSLRFRLQKTNINTQVTITIGDNRITKTIFEWIQRRKDLAKAESKAWAALTDGNRKEGQVPQSNGGVLSVKIRRYYDPEVRDKKLEILNSENSLVDAALEMVNATTDLMD